MNAITIPFLADVEEKRRHPRFPVALPASVGGSMGQASALIHDIGVAGAMIETSLLLLPNAEVQLRCGTINVDACVAWRKANRIGLSFETCLSRRQVTEQMDRSHAIAARRLNQRTLRSIARGLG